MTLDPKDAAYLSQNTAFLRFMFVVIQSAGIIDNNVAADGRSVRDQCLEWHEGRRSLGHEILQLIESGQHEKLRSPDGSPLATLKAVLREAINPQGETHDRPDDRYDDD